METILASQQNAQNFFDAIKSITHADNKGDYKISRTPAVLVNDMNLLNAKLNFFVNNTHDRQDICAEKYEALSKVLKLHQVKENNLNVHTPNVAHVISAITNRLLGLSCDPLVSDKSFMNLTNDPTPLELALRYNDVMSVRYICNVLRYQHRSLPKFFTVFENFQTNSNINAIQELQTQLTTWQNFQTKFSTEMNADQLAKFLRSKSLFYNNLANLLIQRNISADLLEKMTAKDLADLLTEAGYHKSNLRLTINTLRDWMNQDESAMERRLVEYKSTLEFQEDMKTQDLKALLEDTECWQNLQETRKTLQLKKMLCNPKVLSKVHVKKLQHYGLDDFDVDEIMTLCGNQDKVCWKEDGISDHQLGEPTYVPVEFSTSDKMYNKNKSAKMNQQQDDWKCSIGTSGGKCQALEAPKSITSASNSVGLEVGIQNSSNSVNTKQSLTESCEENSIHIKCSAMYRFCFHCNFKEKDMILKIDYNNE